MHQRKPSFERRLRDVVLGGARQPSFTSKTCCNAEKLLSKTNAALSPPPPQQVHPLFCLTKVLLLLDSSKLSLLIDGCCHGDSVPAGIYD